MIFCRQIFFVSLLELDMLVREKKDVHIVGNTHDVIDLFPITFITLSLNFTAYPITDTC